MTRATSVIRKIGVLLLGVPLIIIGIILIPLPGPGLLISFAGFAVLAWEFPWAQRYVDKLKKQVKQIRDAAQAKAGKSSPKK